jgi:hypothetical protein
VLGFQGLISTRYVLVDETMALFCWAVLREEKFSLF